MGDHRLVSQDARCQGPVPIDNVIGRAFVIVWPFGRWDRVCRCRTTFDELPRAVARAGRRAPPVTSDGGAGFAVVAARSAVPLVSIIRAFPDCWLPARHVGSVRD